MSNSKVAADLPYLDLGEAGHSRFPRGRVDLVSRRIPTVSDGVL
jgi:hypothetical protein